MASRLRSKTSANDSQIEELRAEIARLRAEVQDGRRENRKLYRAKMRLESQCRKLTAENATLLKKRIEALEELLGKREAT